MRRVTPIAATHSPSGFFVLRTPLLPHDDQQRWTGVLAASAALDRPEFADDELDRAIANDRSRLRAGLAEFLERPEVRDAIHVASPDLDEAILYWESDPDGDRGRRVERALVR